MDRKKVEKFMQIAEHKAELLSKDPKKKVGAIIISRDGFNELSAGYNGIPRGVKETEERWLGKNKLKWVEHAERNAIYNAARSGTSINNAIMITTRFPCIECARAIIQAGIKTLYTKKIEKFGSWNKEMQLAIEMMQDIPDFVIVEI